MHHARVKTPPIKRFPGTGRFGPLGWIHTAWGASKSRYAACYVLFKLDQYISDEFVIGVGVGVDPWPGPVSCCLFSLYRIGTGYLRHSTTGPPCIVLLPAC